MTKDEEEVDRVHRCLAGTPYMNATLTSKQLKIFLTSTGGSIMACGQLYDIVSKHLGVGIYKVSLKLKKY